MKISTFFDLELESLKKDTMRKMKTISKSLWEVSESFFSQKPSYVHGYPWKKIFLTTAFIERISKKRKNLTEFNSSKTYRKSFASEIPRTKKNFFESFEKIGSFMLFLSWKWENRMSRKEKEERNPKNFFDLFIVLSKKKNQEFWTFLAFLLKILWKLKKTFCFQINFVFSRKSTSWMFQFFEKHFLFSKSGESWTSFFREFFLWIFFSVQIFFAFKSLRLVQFKKKSEEWTFCSSSDFKILDYKWIKNSYCKN